ncbi:MAG: TlpA family protein disulfide reductase [Chryseobacterium sp.]|nr:MAG: TlpA family protein disulfide reductase [Chryseobacterium sp.]
MKNIKSTTLVLIWIFNAFISTAQVSNHRTYNVGEKIPETMVTGLINYHTPNTPLSKIQQGKLLILDFWATWCGPCIGMFPKIDKLQKQFQSNVTFLAVSSEKTKKVTDFLINMRKSNGLEIVSATQDTSLTKLFEFSYIPFYVWIDKTGEIIAMTGADELTEKNIADAVQSKINFKSNPALKLRAFDSKKPVFKILENRVQDASSRMQEQVAAKSIYSYSIASGFMQHCPGKIVFNMDRFSFTNGTISSLYRYYYELATYETPVKGSFSAMSQKVYEMADSILMNKITYAKILTGRNMSEKEILDWTIENAVCYEIVFPAGLSWKQKMSLFKEDIDRYFANRLGFSTHLEKRMDTMTYVLKQINDKIPLANSVGQEAKINEVFHYEQKGLPLRSFMTELRHFYQTKRIVLLDGTGYKGNINLNIFADMRNIEGVNEKLKLYNLQFFKEQKEVGVIVFNKTTIQQPVPDP